MALIIPVMKKEFQLYGTPAYLRHQQKKSPSSVQQAKIQAAREIGRQGSSKQRSEEERTRRLENIRQHRLEKMYSRARQPSCNLRKISEINEDNEAMEQQIVFNARENGFTVLRKLSEEQEDSGHESESRSLSETENDTPRQQHAEKEKHGKVYTMLRWVAKCSKKQKTPEPAKN